MCDQSIIEGVQKECIKGCSGNNGKNCRSIVPLHIVLLNYSLVLFLLQTLIAFVIPLIEMSTHSCIIREIRFNGVYGSKD